MVDTSDEWIVQRTGIHQRRIAAAGEMTSDLALHAARAALDDAKVDAKSIDLIVLGTLNPGQHVSRDGGFDPSRPWNYAGRRLRHPSRLFRVRLWSLGRRRLAPQRGA
jgi:hypothetical protein